MACAVYPGTFDPITLGHLDVLRRAASLFDRVTVAVAKSEAKNPVFTLSERVDLIKDLVADMPNVEVEGFSGLLCDFLRSRNLRVVVRGVRPMGDFADEYQMALTNSSLMPGVETVFIPASTQYQAVKGMLVREIAKMGGDVSAFVSPTVLKALKRKFSASTSKI